MPAVAEFKAAQDRLFSRFGLRTKDLFIDVLALAGRAHVVVAGQGLSVVMVPGFGDPAAMWAPLIAQLDGLTVYAVDRPCFGLTACAQHRTKTIRFLAVSFLEQVLDRVAVDGWLAIDRPRRVAAMTHVGCPALILSTSAPLPMRLLSIPPIGGGGPSIPVASRCRRLRDCSTSIGDREVATAR